MPLRDKLRTVRRTSLATIGLTLVGLSATFYAYAYPFGINHTTQKDSGTPGLGQGCWCHSPNSSSNTTVAIESDQTSFEPNKTYTLKLTVHNTGEHFAGFNIAAKFGSLAAAESGTQIMDGELTHTTPRLLTSGTATWTFRYTAPSDIGTDTIYATGNAVNGNGREDVGDQWNWSPKFVVNIATAAVASQDNATQSLRLWPNPATTSVHVHTSLPAFGYRIVDACGREALRGNGHGDLDLRTSGLAAGVYTFESVIDGRVAQSRKFVVR